MVKMLVTMVISLCTMLNLLQSCFCDVCMAEVQFCTPCIRAMVIESSCIAKSSLFIITCTGGTVGREAELGHAIVIADPAVSKVSASSLASITLLLTAVLYTCICQNLIDVYDVTHIYSA